MPKKWRRATKRGESALCRVKKNAYFCVGPENRMTSNPKKYLPFYLREKFQLIVTVTFTALLSLIFLLVSIPFSNNAWFQLGNGSFYKFTVLFGLAAMFIVVCSNLVMYKTRNAFRITYVGYILWRFAEVILLAALYTVFTVNIAKPSDSTTFGIFWDAFVYTFISLGIPYIISALMLTVINLDKTIRLLHLKDVVSDEPVPEKDFDKITLYDNSGVLKLSVSSSNLYFIESDDNYIQVWYTDAGGSLRKYMLRCRLRTVEESFLGSDLMRCHRKFIVNMAKVKVLRKHKDGYELDLDMEGIKPIPVTKTYAENILARFSDSKA